MEINGKYEEIKNFPGLVGIIDGSRVPMRMPPDRGIDCYNRNDFYSIVFQAVCRDSTVF